MRGAVASNEEGVELSVLSYQPEAAEVSLLRDDGLGRGDAVPARFLAALGMTGGEGMTGGSSERQRGTDWRDAGGETIIRGPVAGRRGWPVIEGSDRRMADNASSDPTTIRVGAVSFLNALPLTHALDTDPDVTLVRAVPAELPGMLERGEVEVALVPVIDTVRHERNWTIVGDGCIACDGATLTVRVFSRVDPADVTRLHVDCDSHSSVALASVLWREKYDRALKTVPFRAADATAETLAECQAVLLIGDKVIDPPLGMDEFSTQIDLGATWKSLTGLPFVFAAWATNDPGIVERAAPILAAARDAGVARAADLASEHAPGIGWPTDLARLYLTAYLDFTMQERHRRGMARFLELAGDDDPQPAPSEAVVA